LNDSLEIAEQWLNDGLAIVKEKNFKIHYSRENLIKQLLGYS